MSQAQHPSKRPSPRFRRRVAMTLTAVFLSALSSWFGWQWLRSQPTQRFVVAAVVEQVPCEVHVDAFLPRTGTTAGQPHPAVILLHGVEGAARYRSAHYRTARGLADQGYAVFFVHYFDGVGYDDLWRLREDGELDIEKIDAACRRDAARWARVVTESLNAIASRSDVDRSRIALDGNSLGGFVALAAAAAALQDDRVADPRAVIVNWGALFETTKLARGFPPTLFVHGEKDTIVPLQSARRAADAVRAVESEATLFVVPDAHHVARSQASDTQTLAFLGRHLGSGSSAPRRATDDERSLREAAMESSVWATNSSFFR